MRVRTQQGQFKQIQLPNQEITELYLNGASVNKLAKQFSVSRRTIQSRLEAMKINTRSQSESERLKWTQMTAEQRSAQVEAAHNISRGRKANMTERLQHAIIRQQTRKPSKYELLFMQCFKEAEFNPIQEFAFGVYNLDFAFPSVKVAVEVDGGNWHTSEVKSFYDKGKEVFLHTHEWELIRVKINRGAITVSTKGQSADLVKILNVICSNPSLWCENRMVSS